MSKLVEWTPMENRLLLRLMSPNTFIVNITVASSGIERDSDKCFLIEVPDRCAATLQPLSEQYIPPGSHIMSDGWAASPMSIQNVLKTWMRAKRKLRQQFGMSRELFPSYLHEFMYRNKCRGQAMFQVFLQTAAENYAL